MLRPLRRSTGRRAAGYTLTRALSAPASSRAVSERPERDGDALDALLGRQVQESVAATSQDMLPALKVLSESLGLLRESPAFRNWSPTDWLMGLTVLAHHNTLQQRKRRVESAGAQRAAARRAADARALLPRLLRYVRVCDAVYAGSAAQFCREAGVDAADVVRSHAGGVFSPKYVLLLDHERREVLLAVRGSASILDFCTDLCLVNEPFLGGQGHRGMAHAASWLASHVREDLSVLAAEYPDYALVTTGHSLGAGVAALATMLLRPAFPSVRCFAFATPASVTRELAEQSAAYVTSVVNGDDCVPRLHQHSLLKLQDEISRFDWRATLRQLVAEEVEDQKIELRRQKEARLGQIQSAFRKLQERNRRQLDEATAKLNDVKRAATQNILELSSDVDRLLADTVDAAFASFKTDKLTLDHIGFMKKLMSLDPATARDRLWWLRLDDSMLMLERLSGVVKRPEELDRVVAELKGLLRASPSLEIGSRNGDDSAESKEGSQVTASEARKGSEVTQLDLLRSRLDDMIRRTSDMVKSKIKEQVSKVSGSVVSNVNEYVDSVKEEAEALGARVQDELDAVQDQVAQRTSSMFTAAEKTLEFDMSSTAAAAAGVVHGVDEPRRCELLHAPLFPPGRILYLSRELADPSPSGERPPADAELETATRVELVEVANNKFSRVVLSHYMILDHLCTTYERVLQQAAASDR